MRMRSLLVLLCILSAAPARALTLAEAQETAAAANPSVKAAMAALKQARAQMQKASLPDPELAAERTADGLNGEAGISQAVPLSGRLSAERAAARAGIEAAELEVELARVAVKAEARKFFHSAAIAVEKARFGEKNEAFALELLNKIEEKVLGGSLGNTDLLRARIELDKARLRRSEAETELIELKSSLNRFMGRVPAAPATLEADPETFRINGPTAGASAEGRLDLRILRLRAEAAGRQVQAEKRRRGLPDLVLGAGAAKNDGTNSPKFSLGLALPLWGGTRGAVMEAEGGSEVLAAQLEEAALDAAHELTVSAAALNLAHQKAQVLQKNLDSAHELRRLASLAYLAGKAQLTEYYEANRVFIDSNLEYLDSVKDYQWAKADYEKAQLAPLSAGEEK
ncbi:MAG: TolC family protein [Elusimicrobiales bacterium]